MIQGVIGECNQQDGTNFIRLQDTDNLYTREALLLAIIDLWARLKLDISPFLSQGVYNET